jgi:hypothetical protein
MTYVYQHMQFTSQFQQLSAYPAPGRSWLIQEYKDERCPYGTEEADQANDQANHHALRDKVAEPFALQEAGESVPLHGLEDVVFGRIKEFRVASLVGSFNGLLDIVQDALWDDDLSLRPRQ